MGKKTKALRDRAGKFKGSIGKGVTPPSAPPTIPTATLKPVEPVETTATTANPENTGRRPRGCPPGTKRDPRTHPQLIESARKRQVILDDIRAECARNGGDTNADAEEISERLKKRGETISPATVKFHIRALLEAKQVVRAAKRKGADGRWTRERLSVPEHPYKATEVLEEAAEIAKRHAEYVGDPEERQRRRERYRRSKGLPESEVTRRVAEPRVSPLTVEELLAADPRGDGPLR